MSDPLTTATETSWLSRLLDAIKSVAVGIVFFLVAFPVLFWNEGRAVKTAKHLERGASSVIGVDAASPLPANEGKLIHLTGELKPAAKLSDRTFGIETTALELRREVEYYQWDERKQETTKKKVGGSTKTRTTYTYEPRWASTIIDSAKFAEPRGHRNPTEYAYDGALAKADRVTVGGFEVASDLVEQLHDAAPLPVSESIIKQLPPRERKRAHVQFGWLYLGDPARPRVGDTRIRHWQVRPGLASLVGEQTGKRIETQVSAGGEIGLVQRGSVSSAAMFTRAQADNGRLTWIIRVLGFVMMLSGLFLVFRPLVVVADVIPFIGDLLGAGVGLFSTGVAACLTTLTVAIAWFVYRPLVGVALLAVAGALVAAAWKLPRRRAI